MVIVYMMVFFIEMLCIKKSHFSLKSNSLEPVYPASGSGSHRGDDDSVRVRSSKVFTWGHFALGFYLLLLWSFFLIQYVSSFNSKNVNKKQEDNHGTMLYDLYFWVGRLFPRSEPDDDKVEPEGRDGQVHVLYLSGRLIRHCCHFSAYGVSFFNFYNILLYTYIF